MSRSPARTDARVLVRRAWPLLLVTLLLVGSEFLPSMELSRGQRASRVAVEQSSTVCPVFGAGGVGTLAVASPKGARDVSLRWFGTRTAAKRLAGPVSAVPPAKKSWAAVVSAGADSATGTDSVLISLASGRLLRGLYAQQCLPTSTSWWFPGVATQYGRADVIVLTNPARSAAVVDIEVLTANGAVHSAQSRGIAVKPRSRTVIPVSSLFPGLSSGTLHVVTTSGQVHAGVLASGFTGTAGTGAQWLPPASPGATAVPVPADLGPATLVIAAEAAAQVSVTARGPGGAFTPLGLESVEIPAGHSVAVAVNGVAPDAAVLRITSSSPVVAGLIGHVSAARGRIGDLTATSAVPTALTSANTFVGVRGLQSRLIIVGDSEGETLVNVWLDRTWNRRITVAAGDAVTLAVPEQQRSRVVHISALQGRFALVTSYRGDGKTLRLATDVASMTRQATVLVRPLAQAER